MVFKEVNFVLLECKYLVIICDIFYDYFKELNDIYYCNVEL